MTSKRQDKEQWLDNGAFARAGGEFPFPMAQVVHLTSEVGGGQYNWERLDLTPSPFSKRALGGRRSGTCWEIGKKTGLPTGSDPDAYAFVFRHRGLWLFKGVPAAGGGGGGGGTPGVFGDASDGALHFTKADNLQPISYGWDLSLYNSSYPAANWGRSSTDWIHAIDRRVLWCSNLTIDAGVVVIPAWLSRPCALFVDGTLTINGEISVSGDDMAYPLLSNTFAGGGATAGGGGSNSVNGGNGAPHDGPIDEQSTSSSGSGAGGNAGAATGGLGSYSLAGQGGYLPKKVGDAPDPNDPSGRSQGYRSFPINLIGSATGGIGEDVARGYGSDGGGGAASVPSGSYLAVGGNGGPGGGRLVICARAVTGTGKIRAEGGRGQPGKLIDLGSGLSGSAGGGGAGDGGVVIVFSDSDLGAGITVSVIKGAHGGAAAGSGSAGAAAGADGYKRCYTKTRTYIP